MDDTDAIFRDQGVSLAVGACQAALSEWGGDLRDVTHLVAVTATNAGAPGYDQLVAKELGVSESTEKVLLSGVGCAGGLAALRLAVKLVQAASYQKRPACVLVVACELCSVQVRSELEFAKDKADACIGPALFGDGAASLVLTNSAAIKPGHPGLFSVETCFTGVLPNTTNHMSYRTTQHGFLLRLSKEVPHYTGVAIQVAFTAIRQALGRALREEDCDFAVHPGGLSVLKSCQKAMGLTNHSMRASYSVYAERGNTSSVTVLAVLDKLRRMGPGKEQVIASSFGPGLTVEMAVLKRHH